MTTRVLIYGAIAWWAVGFLSYLVHEVRHRRMLERRYQPTNIAFFPPIGAGIFLGLLGPLLLLVGLVARAPVIKRTSAAANSRAHPVQHVLDDEEDEPIRVAK